MAMTKCKECGKEISTKAESCPHCGAKRKRTSGCLLVVLAVLLLFVFAAVVNQCSQSAGTGSPATAAEPAQQSSASSPAPAESPEDQETREMIWVERGKDAARAKLKDPDSAKFQNVFFHRGTNNIPLACGEVNSKNSFGGYGGFQRFISAGQADLTFLEEQMDSSEFVKVWNEMCVK